MADGAKFIEVVPKAATEAEVELSAIEVMAAAMGMGTVELYALAVTGFLLIAGTIALMVVTLSGSNSRIDKSTAMIPQVGGPGSEKFNRGSREANPDAFRELRRDRQRQSRRA